MEGTGFVVTWADQIDAACERGGGAMRCLDLLRLLRRGLARLWIWPNLHASAFLTRDGLVEIFHVFGRWNDDEARDLLGNLKTWGHYHGRSDGRVWGRNGWLRFLRLRGIEMGVQ